MKTMKSAQELVRTFLTILTHKEIFPPPTAGVVDELIENCRHFLGQEGSSTPPKMSAFDDVVDRLGRIPVVDYPSPKVLQAAHAFFVAYQESRPGTAR